MRCRLSWGAIGVTTPQVWPPWRLVSALARRRQVGVALLRRLVAVRVLRHPKGPGRSIDVVRRPVLLWVRRGPCRPPVVIDHERRLMFNRTPGRIR
jgi:hypothetical protein